MSRHYCFRCGREFDPVRSDQMYCSKRCRLKEYESRRKAASKDRKADKYAGNGN